MTAERGRPTYRLEEMWKALAEGRYLFRRPARDGFTSMGWTEADALQCLRALSTRWFQKSMPGKNIKGWHVVYRADWSGERVYIHFCRTDQDVYVIAAMKRDTQQDT